MSTALIVLAGFAILAIVAFVVMTRYGDKSGYDYAHTQRTAETGTAAKARVLRMRDTGGRLNSNPAVEFELQVEPADGPPFVATTRAIISTVELPRFQVGATIDVRYDPADRSSVAVVP